MTLTVELAPELVAALRGLAQKAGLDPDHYVARALQEHVTCYQTAPDYLPREEAALLQQLSRGLPGQVWKRYRELVSKRQAFTLTPAEHTELMGLTNEVELWHARRVELVAELARRRRVPLARMMDELGLTPEADA